jgi:hypothetical protein
LNHQREKVGGVKRIFSFCIVIIAIFLLVIYFKDSIRKVLTFDSFRDSIGKVLSVAHQSLSRIAVATTSASDEKSTSQPGEPPRSTSAPVLELTNVPLTGVTESFTTLDGEHYTGIIKRVEPDGIVLRTSDGVPKLKFKNLPPEVGAKYGYDPELELQFLRFRNRADIEAQQNAEKIWNSENVAAEQKAEKIYEASVRGSSNALSTAPSLPAAGKSLEISKQADSLVQNGDFSQGKTGWSGDGQPLTDYLRYHPQAMSTNLPAHGLIIELSSKNWSKLYQRIGGGKNPNYVLKMTYVLSPGITLSTLPDDYMNMITHIRISEWQGSHEINISPGEFFDTIIDSTDNKGYYEKYTPNLAITDEQIYEHDVPPLPPSGGKTITVAFPPGKGFVLIKSITVTSH